MTWGSETWDSAAVGVVAAEGAAGVVAGIVFVVASLVGRPHDEMTAVILGVLLVVFGAGLLALARALARGRHWPRTPSYLAQFFGLVVAWYQRSTLPAVSVVLLVVCVGAVVALTQSSASRPSRS
ncbi:MAG TPA: hypothetical protein VFJ17_03770 [Mycobacteriales bacterium]|nr:hypothetical protein [Mycobacteriales bacterium]